MNRIPIESAQTLLRMLLAHLLLIHIQQMRNPPCASLIFLSPNTILYTFSTVSCVIAVLGHSLGGSSSSDARPHLNLAVHF